MCVTEVVKVVWPIFKAADEHSPKKSLLFGQLPEIGGRPRIEEAGFRRRSSRVGIFLKVQGWRLRDFSKAMVPFVALPHDPLSLEVYKDVNFEK